MTIAGLLAGADILAGVRDPGQGDLVLLPGTALNDDACFIDGVALSAVADRLAPARVRAGHDLVETLMGAAAP